MPRENYPALPTEPVIRNKFALLQLQWKALSNPDAFTTYAKSISTDRAATEAFVRAGVPLLPKKMGATTDANDNVDIPHITAWCPELNMNTLVSQGNTGIADAMLRIANVATWKEFIRDAAQNVMECLNTTGPTTPRRDWMLVTHPQTGTEPAGDIVEIVDGAVQDTKFQGTQEELSQLFVTMQARRANNEWLPRYARQHIIARVSTLLDAALGWLSAFTIAGATATAESSKAAAACGKMLEKLKEKDAVRHQALTGRPKDTHTVGCLFCGKAIASKGVTCSKCEVARFCSGACQSKDKAHDTHCAQKPLSLSNLRDHLESISLAAANDPEFKVVKQLCDMKKNEEDAYGDGDQSKLKQATNPSQKEAQFHTLRSNGLDFNPQAVTKFMQACLYGDLQEVKDKIEGCDMAGGPELVHQLVNRRESLLRMSPLLGAICGSKLVGSFMPPRRGVPPKFEEVIEALIEAGSKVDAKDCAGFSTIHHATSGNCSEASLRLLPILVKHGADPNVRNRFGDVAMAESITAGRAEAVRSLIQAGADPTEAAKYAMFNPEIKQILVQCGPMRGLRPGTEVALKGLVSQPKLNGKKAVIAEDGHVLGRYQVKIMEVDGTPGRSISVKMENLTRLETSSCAACGAPAALRCSRCKKVFYCAAACQRGHWAQHKETCLRDDSENPTAAGAGKKIIVPAQTENFSMEMTGGPMRAPQANAAKKLKGKTVIIKAQVGVDMLSGAALKENPVCLYDEKKTFMWHVANKGKSAEAHALLVDMVTKSTTYRGLKCYVKGKFLASGDLEIDTEILAAQPW